MRNYSSSNHSVWFIKTRMLSGMYERVCSSYLVPLFYMVSLRFWKLAIMKHFFSIHVLILFWTGKGEKDGRREERSKGARVKKCLPQFLVDWKFSSRCQHLKWAHIFDYKLVSMVVISGEITKKLTQKYVNKGHKRTRVFLTLISFCWCI